MTEAALARMAARRAPLRLVVFDCDGVLVDSEPVANRVMAEEATRAGWTLDTAGAIAAFAGKDLTAIRAIIEAQAGIRLPDEWLAATEHRIVAALAAGCAPVPGAIEALHAASAMGLAWRVASNSSHAEMAAKFGCLGLIALVAGRLHSFADVPRGKPAPDVYLAAAAAEGVAPAECVAVEDTATGARAAVAAGMECLGYAPHGDGAALAAAGAVPFASMADLPGILAVAARRAVAA